MPFHCSNPPCTPKQCLSLTSALAQSTSITVIWIQLRFLSRTEVQKCGEAFPEASRILVERVDAQRYRLCLVGTDHRVQVIEAATWYIFVIWGPSTKLWGSEQGLLCRTVLLIYIFLQTRKIITSWRRGERGHSAWALEALRLWSEVTRGHTNQWFSIEWHDRVTWGTLKNIQPGMLPSKPTESVSAMVKLSHWYFSVRMEKCQTRQTLAILAKISVSHSSEAAEGGQTRRSILTLGNGSRLHIFEPLLKALALHKTLRNMMTTTGYGNPLKLRLECPAVVRWELAIKMNLQNGKGFTFLAHLELVDHIFGLFHSHQLPSPHYTESIHSLAVLPMNVTIL